MSNIRDVAKAANVSITTVSRILTNDSTLHVSDETRKNVHDVIQKLNYQYKPKKPQINIGCILSLTYNYSDPYFLEILNGIQSYCASHNAVISLIVSYSQFHDMKAGLEEKIAALDGLIVTELPSNRLEYLRSLNNRLVFIDNYVNGYCNIGFNEIFANQLVMDHLISCGYKKIAYIGGSDNNEFNYSNRMMVYRNALNKHHLPYDSSIIYNCEWDPELCAKQVNELLEHNPDIDAIFAGSDSLATVIIRQLNEAGLSCPDDIGVVGFNDNDISKNFSPPITTVRLPSKKMGELGAEMLINQITDKKELNYQIVLPVELMVRKSTKKRQI